ncbi:hypothetical protein HYQ44_019030 [Verticillium longisporum]|nr:hypothetical protein HYQ44_019030 [Verticillium longisporum]
MAAAPDITNLTSSADVFAANHTLPQIRAIHRALHVQIDDKAARLRTQVGSSYRGLLGTADSIVQMRKDNDAVQALLARMGHRCGRAVVGRKLEGYAEFAPEAEDPRMAVFARARLLDACALVVGKLLLKGRGAAAGHDAKLGPGDRLLLGSEVLVLSRLLSKGFTREELDREPDVALVVETARKSLEGLRRRLLRSIEKFLEKTADNQAQRQEHTLKALCAYSLATSSGARDVLKHFLTVRSKAMSAAFYADDAEAGRQQGGANVLKSQLLYVRTLLDVQALVPFKLSDALAKLKKRPLLQGDVLRNVEALRLDVYERWCGDDILTFTPFVRHDDLDGPQARSMLTSWAERGGEVLVAGLRSTMERMTEFKAVIDLRTNVLRLWIRDGGKARGFDPSEMLDALREAINGHLLALIDAKVHKLHLVASEVAATLDAWKDGVTDRPAALWAQTTLDIDPAAGVDAFLQDLVAQLHGRNDAVARAVACFASWRRVIGEVEGVVDQLKKQRWENDGDDDDDEIEDEETIDARHDQLSRDDPAALHDRLDATLARAFADLETRLADLWRARADAVNAGRVATAPALRGFGLDMVPSLHDKLALAVSAAPVEVFASRGLTQKLVVGRPLWEGHPELPTQPSPLAFKFLRDLSVAMSDAGVDLWSATAVGVVKRKVRQQVCEAWLEAVEVQLDGSREGDQGKAKDDEKKDETSADGEDEDEDSDEEAEAENEAKDGSTTEADAVDDDKQTEEQQRQDLFTQWFFDINLFECAFGPAADSASTAGELPALGDKVYSHTGLDGAEARKRIAASSREHWRKTSLLFGLLA